MKKIIFFLNIFLISKSSLAQLAIDDLKCSANGTVVLYVPDAMSTDVRITKETQSLVQLLKSNSGAIDLKSQSVDFLPLKSPGLSTAKLSYFLNSISDPTIRESAWMVAKKLETGVEVIEYAELGGGVLAILPVVKKGLKASVNAVKATPLKKKIGFVKRMIPNIPTGITNLLTPQGLVSTASLLYQGESWRKALENQYDLRESYSKNNQNITKLRDKIKNLMEDNYKKVIISAHGDGNILAKSAVEDFLIDHQRSVDYIGVLATSPTTQPYPNIFRYKYIKNNFDNRIGGAGGIPSNFLISNFSDIANINTAQGRRNYLVYLSHMGASDFLDDYMSDVLNGNLTFRYEYAGQIINDEVTDTAVNIYTHELKRVSRKLGSNCQSLKVEGIGGPVNTNLLFTVYNLEGGYAQIQRNAVFDWDFGDGTTVTTSSTTGVSSVNHKYLDDGKYTLRVKVTTYFEGENFVNTSSSDVIVTRPYKEELVSGTDVYAIKEYRSYEYIDSNGYYQNEKFAGRLHKREGTYTISGPKGTFGGFGPWDSIGEFYRIDCGSWTKVFNDCTRGNTDPPETIISVHDVSQCGGEGCESLPLGRSPIGVRYVTAPLTVYPTVYYPSTISPQPFADF